MRDPYMDLYIQFTVYIQYIHTYVGGAGPFERDVQRAREASREREREMPREPTESRRETESRQKEREPAERERERATAAVVLHVVLHANGCRQSENSAQNHMNFCHRKTIWIFESDLIFCRLKRWDTTCKIRSCKWTWRLRPKKMCLQTHPRLKQLTSRKCHEYSASC